MGYVLKPHNLIPRVLAKFKMEGSREDHGTHCKIVHKLWSVLSCDRQFIFINICYTFFRIKLGIHSAAMFDCGKNEVK